MFRCYEFCKFSDMHVLVAVTGEERWVCFTEQEEEVDSGENNEFFSTPFIFSLLSHLTSFSFFTTRGFIFTTSHHHHRSLPPLLSLPPSPLSTAGIQSPSHTTNPLHYRQQAFSPSRSSSPSYVLQQTSNLEKIDGFVKPGGWNEFYIARGRTCSETVSKQGEANDGNCNNGYCSGCSSSIVRHASAALLTITQQEERNSIFNGTGLQKM
ncbi:hypothetical protein QL285_072438 [Trifolium repens]|nr:hypothetical protein QL285_072438 [Trifolium repens]